jgi:signal transduction histidine kinase
MRRLPARFDDLRIKHKILAGHIALIVPLGAIVILVAAMGSQILAQSASISRDLVPALANLESVRSTGLDVIETTNTYVVTSLNGAPNTQTRGSRLADAAEAALQARNAFDKAVNGVPPTKSDQGGSTLRQDIAFARDAILAQGGKVASLIADGAPTSVVVQLSDDFTDAAASFRALIDSAIELEQAKLRARQRELDANIWVSIVIVTAFGLAAMGLALTGGHYIAKRIATPILELHDAAVRIGEGSFESLPPNHSRDEVGALVTAFRNMVDQLKDMVERLARQERLATLGQLAGTVGHELRNPLFAITNSLYILREEIRDQTDGTKRALARIDRNVERCNAIVGDLLDYARPRELHREEVEVDKWLAEMLDDYAVPDGVTLRRELAPAGAAMVDRNRFRQVMVNLLDNAAQAIMDARRNGSPAGPRQVTVRTQHGGPFVRIEVRDTGPGIPSDKLPKIFEPLFTTKSFGVGLGLPTVRQIVEEHGGTVDAACPPGEGATFTICLPRRSGQPAEAA